jgi:hypothetical protein
LSKENNIHINWQLTLARCYTLQALGLCSRLWQNSSLAPDWHELDNARVALREVAASHFPAELAKARELQVGAWWGV